MKKRQKRRGSIRRKLSLIVLPIILISYFVTYDLTLHTTKKLLQNDARKQMRLVTESSSNEMTSQISEVYSIMENIKVSVQNTCTTDADIKKYIYGVADAYPDLVPAGIYCGLCSGEYIDKVWTPDADWVMEERPWYQDGLTSDEVTFGEMYLDANTKEYIISAYTNIKDSQGKVIGVICADVKMDKLAEILSEKKIFDNGYIYAVDQTSGMVFGNAVETDQNGQTIQDLKDEHSVQASKLLEEKKLDQVVSAGDSYYCINQVPNSNFITVCIAKKADVEKEAKGTQDLTFTVSVICAVILCVVIYLAISLLLRPVGKIMKMMDHIKELDLTERAKLKVNDELGGMADGMNTFADHIQQVLGNMRQAIEEVDEKANVNASVASEMNDMAGKQDAYLSDLMNTMSQLSTAIHEIADNTTSLSQSVAETNTNAELVENRVVETLRFVDGGNKEIGQLTDTMTQVADASKELQTAVEDVEQGLQGINGMVGVINDIAEQTSLLSLNASIEAARAGEAGKGFAVVAEQIRKLADDCAESVEDIVETTQQMSDRVAVVTERTSDSIRMIREGNQMASRTSGTFHDISETMNAIDRAITQLGKEIASMENVATDMAASTQEQSAGTESVLNACGEAMDIAHEFTEQGSKMETAGEQLRKISEELNELIRQFKME